MARTIVVLVRVDVGIFDSVSHGSSSFDDKVGTAVGDLVPYAVLRIEEA
jgi:hypothetical protein